MQPLYNNMAGLHAPHSVTHGYASHLLGVSDFAESDCDHNLHLC